MSSLLTMLMLWSLSLSIAGPCVWFTAIFCTTLAISWTVSSGDSYSAITFCVLFLTFIVLSNISPL